MSEVSNFRVAVPYIMLLFIGKVNIKVGYCCSLCNRAKQSRIMRYNTLFKGLFIRRLRF